jgi:hypothetical protein
MITVADCLGGTAVVFCHSLMHLRSRLTSVYAIQPGELRSQCVTIAQSPIPAAERSKARVCARSLAGIAGSNPNGGMDVCVVCVL